MNIYTEMSIESPEDMPWMDDDELESMIEHHKIPAIDAFNALLERKWLMWLKEHNLTRDDGNEITYLAQNYEYVWNFLENVGWFDIYRDVKERIEVGYDVHIVFNGREYVVADTKKSEEIEK